MFQSGPGYADIVNYLITGKIPDGWNKHHRDTSFQLLKFYIWDNPYLFEYGSDQIIRKCVPGLEVKSILSFNHN